MRCCSSTDLLLKKCLLFPCISLGHVNGKISTVRLSTNDAERVPRRLLRPAAQRTERAACLILRRAGVVLILLPRRSHYPGLNAGVAAPDSSAACSGPAIGATTAPPTPTPTAQQARQIQQDPGPPHHVVPAGIRTSSSTSGVGDRRKRPRRGARHIAPRRASPPASSLPVLRRAAPPQSLLFLPSQAGCSGIREPASRAPMSPPLTAPAPPPACNLCLGHLLTRNTRSCSRRRQRKRGTSPSKERTTWPAVLRTTPGLREPEPSPAGAREAAPAVAGA